MAEPAKFQIIDIGSEYAFEFPLFPNEINVDDGANWEPQDTTIGKKPLFYRNMEPRRISIQEAYIDNTNANVSAVAELQLLQMQLTELEEGGPPPALLVVWGEQTYRCVLTQLSSNQSMFVEGNPTRLRLSMEFLELQPEGESTSVNVGN